MKFMVSWRVHDGKRHEALKHFSQMSSDDDLADRGDRIKLIGRWHDMQRFTGVAIIEADDARFAYGARTIEAQLDGERLVLRHEGHGGEIVKDDLTSSRCEAPDSLERALDGWPCQIAQNAEPGKERRLGGIIG